jgi:ligand-binding SRPBCC domain-containing protein
MPKFELKNFDTDNWKWLSEVEALGILQKNFEQVTPKITEVLNGKEIKTPDGILRVKE